MKKLKITALVIMLALILPLFSVVKSDAAVKLNAKSKNLFIGNSVTIKISGTNGKKVIWSTSNNRIRITKKTKTYAKVKGINKGISYLKAKVGKKTYKCKIIVKKNTSTATKKPTTPTVSNVSYKLLDTDKGIVAILRNNNSSVISLDAKVVYYKDGVMLDTSSAHNYAFENGKTCALWFSPPYDGNYNSVSYDDYKINISVDKSYYNICVSDDILIDDNIGADKVVATIENNSGKNLNSIQIAVVFYDAYNNVIGYDYDYAECEKAGATDYLTFDFPLDSNYDIIIPGDYEIFVNHAYSY